MCTENNVDSFLLELADLCMKHHVTLIGGCGCCGSPYVEIDGETVITELLVCLDVENKTGDINWFDGTYHEKNWFS